MAKGFAIHNAPTDHGGFIPATQMRSSQMGNLFVVAGDGYFCPKCKCWSTVIKSHDHVIFDGKPVAYVGDLLTCGREYNLSKAMWWVIVEAQEKTTLILKIRYIQINLMIGLR